MMEGAFLFFVMITCVGSLLSAYLKTMHWSFYLCFHLRYLHQTSTLSLSNIYVIFIKHLRYLYHTSTLSLSKIYDMYDADIGFSHDAEPIFTWCGAYTHIVSIGSGPCQEPLETMSKAAPLHVRKGLKSMLGKFFRRKGNGNKVLPCWFFWRHNINLLIMSYLWIL